MKRLLLIALGLALHGGSAAANEDSLSAGRFGRVRLYYQTPQPAQVVLFVSGDGGWNLGVVDMARELASLNALVAGIDITHYIKALGAGDEKCSYPAADFESLSKAVQKKLGYERYVQPILVGYSSGATLVYATLVQAPFNTFRGAISLGFCPDLLLPKPMCRGSGLEWTAGPKGKGYIFSPAMHLEVPWVALQGTIDQVCNPPATEKFVRQVPGAEFVLLPKVGHGFSVPSHWMPQFKAAFARLAARADTNLPPPAGIEQLQDLPLVEVTASGQPANSLGVLLTGDGGFGVTDRGLANSLAAHGIPVVALNSLHYFWSRRSPDGAAADLERILHHYLAAWKKEKIVCIGYSLGADVLPFMLDRLPADLRARIQVIALLGLGDTADFEFHLTDWLGGRARKTELPVRPELEKLRGTRILCFYGTEDKESLCRGLDSTLAQSIAIDSGHRFGHNFESIASAILGAAQ